MLASIMNRFIEYVYAMYLFLLLCEMPMSWGTPQNYRSGKRDETERNGIDLINLVLLTKRARV